MLLEEGGRQRTCRVVETHGSSSAQTGGLAGPNEIGEDDGVVGVGDGRRKELYWWLSRDPAGPTERAGVGVAVPADELEGGTGGRGVRVPSVYLRH